MTAPLDYRGGRMFPQDILNDLERRLGAVESQQKLRAALVKAREFVDRHSEPWYGDGQRLLKEIDEALK